MDIPSQGSPEYCLVLLKIKPSLPWLAIRFYVLGSTSPSVNLSFEAIGRIMRLPWSKPGTPRSSFRSLAWHRFDHNYPARLLRIGCDKYKNDGCGAASWSMRSSTIFYNWGLLHLISAIREKSKRVLPARGFEQAMPGLMPSLL